MIKKRIFAAVLALGMLAAQNGAFAKVLSNQDFTAGEGYQSTKNDTNIWGGWSTITGYSNTSVVVNDGKIEMFRPLTAPHNSTTPNDVVMVRDISGVEEGVDDYLVIEFDWYRLRYELEFTDDTQTSYQFVEETEPVMLPPLGDQFSAWKCGFGVYYTNESEVDIPLFFMSPIPWNHDSPEKWTFNTYYSMSTGTEAPEVTEPSVKRQQMSMGQPPSLTTEKNYRYRLVINLNKNEAGKYPYEMYLKGGYGDYVNLTQRADYDHFALTYNEIPTKIRIGARLKTGYRYTSSGELATLYTYDFDGNGEVSPFCDKTIVDNYLCYTIDTDEAVSKVTYLDSCGNATDEIIAGEAYTPSVTYNNETGETLPLTMITGMYDADDYYFDSIPEVKTVPAGMGAISGTANVFNVAAGDIVKGFAWNNFEKMIPYNNFVSITAIAPTVDEEVTE